MAILNSKGESLNPIPSSSFLHVNTHVVTSDTFYLDFYWGDAKWVYFFLPLNLCSNWSCFYNVVAVFSCRLSQTLHVCNNFQYIYKKKQVLLSTLLNSLYSSVPNSNPKCKESFIQPQLALQYPVCYTTLNTHTNTQTEQCKCMFSRLQI